MSRMGRPAAYVDEIKALKLHKLYTALCIVDRVCPPGSDSEKRTQVRLTLNSRQRRLLDEKGRSKHAELPVGNPAVWRPAWAGFEWQLTLGSDYFSHKEWKKLLQLQKQYDEREVQKQKELAGIPDVILSDKCEDNGNAKPSCSEERMEAPVLDEDDISLHSLNTSSTAVPIDPAVISAAFSQKEHDQTEERSDLTEERSEQAYLARENEAIEDAREQQHPTKYRGWWHVWESKWRWVAVGLFLSGVLMIYLHYSPLTRTEETNTHSQKIQDLQHLVKASLSGVSQPEAIRPNRQLKKQAKTKMRGRLGPLYELGQDSPMITLKKGEDIPAYF